MSRTRNRQRSRPPKSGQAVVNRHAPVRGAGGRTESASGFTFLLNRHGWTIAVVIVMAAVAFNLGALDWYTGESITRADGSSDQLPNTFASIDHPFHINKERAVLDAIRQGEFPRWFSDHQAGYPAEFYPLGADLIVVAAWGAGFGLAPLEVVHKLVVIAVLFIPIAAWWAISRRDGLPGSIPAVAAILHLFVPGSWLGGGPDELLRMGMWPNVFATYLTLPLLLWAAGYLRHGSQRGLALAAVTAALAIYTNPRAAVAVAIVLLALGIVALAERRQASSVEATANPTYALNVIVQRSLLITAVVGLLSSALIVPLRANQHLYEFTTFVDFDSASRIWEYFSGALPLEITVVAVIGAIVVARSGQFHSRVLALLLPLATCIIIVLDWTLSGLQTLAQFEGPRLLPLVRLSALYLAAIGIHAIVTSVLRRTRLSDIPCATGLAAVAFTAVIVLTPLSPLSATERGLPPLETTDQAAFPAIARSAETFSQASTPSDRPLIVGSPLSDHASFWIPALAESQAFHAAWVWYWHSPAYAHRTEIADVNAALDLDFLRRHALTLVLIATNGAETLTMARTKPHLEPVDPGEPGGFAIFRVVDAGPSVRGPVSVADGEVTRLGQTRERLRANIDAHQATEVRIGINDFPAWQASVNGHDAAIRRTDDGYILVSVPAGENELELTYTVQPAVWIGRALTLLGAVLLAAILITPRFRRRTDSG